MLTLEVNRQFVEQPAEAETQYKGASPLLTPTQSQQEELANCIVDFLDRIDSCPSRNKSKLADIFCEKSGQMLAQMIDCNMRIDPNHLDGLVECGLKILKYGLNTPATSQFAELLSEARNTVVLPTVNASSEQAAGQKVNQSPAADKFVAVYGIRPISA